MEITYIAHSCFKIKGKDLTLIIDPYDPNSTGQKFVKVSADVVLLSHFHDDHSYVDGIGDYELLIDSPGQYEKNGVFINGYKTYHDNKQGEERGKNTVYVIEIDDITIMHLGDLGHELSKETIEKIPDIDVLLIPVGGVYTIDAETAVKVISSIEPGFVIPMHYQTPTLKLPEKLDGVEKFLDEMGADDVERVDTFKTSKSSIPEDDTEVVIINPKY